MSEPKSQRSVPSTADGSTERPAVGLIVDGADSDAVAGSILRARQRGHVVFVSFDSEPTDEAIAFAQELDAPVVDFKRSASGTTSDPENDLARTAREAGFPGVILHDPADPGIDFQRSTSELRSSNRYVVSSISVRDSGGDGIVVGIPAYNEEVTIGSTVLRASAYAEEVIVVDDGSTDDTVDVASEAGATVIEQGANRGKGAAVRTLLEYTSGLDFDALVLMDGDGQHSPADIPSVTEAVLEEEADVAIGSRYLDGREHDTPRYRRLGQRVLDVLTVGSSRTRVTDSQSGFRTLSPKAVQRIELRSDGFGVESEMIEAASRNGLDVVERPIDVRYDVEGSTENPFRHGLAVTVFLVQLVRDRHPLLFFGVPGMVLAAFGLAYGLDGILVYRATGTFYPAKAMISGFLTIIGTLGIFAGFVLNQIANILAVGDGAQR